MSGPVQPSLYIFFNGRNGTSLMNKNREFMQECDQAFEECFITPLGGNKSGS